MIRREYRGNEKVKKKQGVKLTDRLLSHLLTHLLPACRKDLVKLKLGPSDIGAQAGKLPHAFDLLIPVQVETMRVAADGDFGEGGVFVDLVGNPKLVVADDFVVVDFFPFGAADEVLGAEERVADYERV